MKEMMKFYNNGFKEILINEWIHFNAVVNDNKHQFSEKKKKNEKTMVELYALFNKFRLKTIFLNMNMWSILYLI